MNNSSICVGVTALKTVESPQPGFGVARSLKESGYKVVGIDDTPLTSAICAPYFDKVYTVKALGTENFEEFYDSLKKIKKETKLQVIIPCYDREVFFFNKHKEEIKKLGIRLLIPSIKSLKLSSKPFLHKLGKYGIKVPRTISVSNKEELISSSKKLGFPLVCKGVIKDAYIANNLPELILYFYKIREVWHGGRGSVVLQEFIVGDFYCVSGVTNYESDLIRVIQMKKLGIDSKGTTWSGYTIYNEKLARIANKIIKTTKWIGPFEFEFIKHYKTGKYYLFEINPRLPSWIYLSTVAGQNMAEAIVKIALKENIKSNLSYTKDLAFTRLAEEIVYPKKYLEHLNFNGKLPEHVKNKQGGVKI
jgi:carbamoyl-phosphate synthase large subunit